MTVRPLVVLYAGDYRDAYNRMVAGEPETYHGHRYAIGQLQELSKTCDEVAVLCCRSAEPYDESPEPGLRWIGAASDPNEQFAGVAAAMERFDPSHAIVRTPVPQLFGWLNDRGIPTLGVLADSFPTGGLRNWVRRRRTAKALRLPAVEYMSNHGWNSSRALLGLGLDPAKVLPWDWPHVRSPHDNPAKPAPAAGGEISLVYVGSVSVAKGVHDAIDAVATLRAQGRAARLDVIGGGATDEASAHARAAGVDDAVTMVGLVDNGEVVPRMRAADVVLVPSRHEYPEGFPLTIYEAFCSRTPIVASDHPMFAGFLAHGESALVHPAGDGAAMAARISELVDDAALYQRLSEASAPTWERLQVPVLWGDLVRRWVSGTPEDRAWLDAHTLAALDG